MILRRNLFSTEPLPALEGAGPVALLVHGWASDADSMRDVAEALGDRWLCVLLDLPGHGPSAAPGDPCDLASSAGALAALWQAVQAVGRPVVLVGWSWGGTVALASVAAGGGGPAGLVLSGGFARLRSGPGCDAGVKEGVLAAMIRAFEEDPARVLASFGERMFSAADRERPGFAKGMERLAGGLRRGSPLMKLAMLNALATADLREAVTGLNVPVRLLHGTEDAIVPTAAGQWIADHVPRAVLETVPGAGHGLPLCYPERVAALAADLPAGGAAKIR
jgi:pimeloyl-ACP methyl ester carboxylesterase